MYHSAQPLQAGLGENSVLGTDCRFGARFLATAGRSAIYACAQKAGIAPQWERERRASAACQRAARPGGYRTWRAGALETECAADFREFCHRQSQSARARVFVACPTLSPITFQVFFVARLRVGTAGLAGRTCLVCTVFGLRLRL